MNPVTPENYVDHAMRTDTPITEELIMRLTDPDFIRLLHAGMGLCTESGEFMDMLKRHLFYGKPLDYVNAREELGDMAWYTALAVDVIRTTIHEVMTVNINKLKLRYPEKFNEKSALERNLDEERKVLEHNADYIKSRESVDNLIMKDMKRIDPETDYLIGEGYRKNIMSQRGQDWIKFSEEVLAHIENYTVPQYSDKGEDQIADWSVEECLKAVSKRIARYGRNSREGQQFLDFLKMAHETEIAYTKLKEGN